MQKEGEQLKIKEQKRIKMPKLNNINNKMKKISRSIIKMKRFHN